MILPKPFAVGTLVYQALYGVGLAPWERMKGLPIGGQISDLLDWVQEEGGIERGPQRGRALDLGCGRGLWSIDLATRGWNVTGIDIVGSALKVASENARDTRIENVRFVQGDMLDLQAADIGSGFELILDFGGVHGLEVNQFPDVGKEITAIAASGAYLVVVAAEPGTQKWPQPRGMSFEEIEETYKEWEVIKRMKEEPPEDVKGPVLGLYLLKRR